MEMITALFVTSLLLPGGRSECTFCRIISYPEDITVMAGEPARFNCTIAINLDLHADWYCGGFIVGPWPEYTMGYEYPADAHISLGTYDLVVPKVSWQDHHNMQCRCQIRELQKASDFAKLTVIVPPAIEMAPDPGLIKYDWSEKEAEILCFTNFATPGFQIEWTLDGQAINNVSETRNVKRERGGHLIQLNSTIVLPLEKRWQQDSVLHADNATGKGSASPLRLRDYRAFLQETYAAVRHVTCRVVSNETWSKTKEQSAWVVRKVEFKTVVSAAQRGCGRNTLYYFVVGGSAILVVVLAVISLLVRRRCGTQPENPEKESDDGEYGFSNPFGDVLASEKDGEEMLSECNSSRGVRLSQALSSPLTVSTAVSDTEENPPPNQPLFTRFRRFSRVYRDAGESDHVTRPGSLKPYSSLRLLTPMPSLEQSHVSHASTLQRPGLYGDRPYQFGYLPRPALGAGTLPPRRIASFSVGSRPPVTSRGEEAGSLV